MSSAIAERSEHEPSFRALFPGTRGRALTLDEVLERFSLSVPRAAEGRPRVLLNMASTVDGRASIAGRSAPISSAADRELFHGLRQRVDAVIVGAGTARTERYKRMIWQPERRRERRERGLAGEPLACLVSSALTLSAELVPLLGEPQARVAVVTDSRAELPQAGLRAKVDYVRAARNGRLDLAAALAQLSDRFDVGTLLCEGGPRLGCELLQEALVDEVLLSVGPRLAGGRTGDPNVRILAGRDLDPPLELELLDALESAHQLFLRYRVLSVAGGPVGSRT